MRFSLALIPVIALIAATGDDWIARLGGAATRNARGEITALNFRSSWLEDSDLRSIGAIGTLQKLDLSHTRVTDLGFPALKDLANVEEMNLYYTEQIGDGALVVMRNWKKLKRLNLRGTKVTDLGVAQLANHPSLEWLDVGYSLYTDGGFEPLTTIPNLRHIAAGGNKVTDVGLNLLRLTPNLTSLDLAGGQRTDSGVWAASVTDRGLETIGQLRNLQSLNLRGSKITDAGMGRLATLAALTSLDLGQTSLSARGLAPLAAMKQLQQLSLYQCQKLNDEAIPALSALKSLKWLDLEGSGITPSGLTAIRNALPQARIEN